MSTKCSGQPVGSPVINSTQTEAIPSFSSFAEKFPSPAHQVGLSRASVAAPGSDSAGVHGGGGGGGNEGDTFVVQRGRTVPTLSSVTSTTDKEQLNQVHIQSTDMAKKGLFLVARARFHGDRIAQPRLNFACNGYNTASIKLSLRGASMSLDVLF